MSDPAAVVTGHFAMRGFQQQIASTTDYPHLVRRSQLRERTPLKSARCVSLLHSLQFVRLEVSEQSLKIHIRKQQPPRPRVLMHFMDQQFRAPAESHSVAEETAGRREFDAHRQRSHQVRAGTINIPQNSHVTACFRRLACVGAL